MAEVKDWQQIAAELLKLTGGAAGLTAAFWKYVEWRDKRRAAEEASKDTDGKRSIEASRVAIEREKIEDDSDARRIKDLLEERKQLAEERKQINQERREETARSDARIAYLESVIDKLREANISLIQTRAENEAEILMKTLRIDEFEKRAQKSPGTFQPKDDTAMNERLRKTLLTNNPREEEKESP